MMDSTYHGGTAVQEMTIFVQNTSKQAFLQTPVPTDTQLNIFLLASFPYWFMVTCLCVYY